MFLASFTIEAFLVLVASFSLSKGISAVLAGEVGGGKV